MCFLSAFKTLEGFPNLNSNPVVTTTVLSTPLSAVPVRSYYYPAVDFNAILLSREADRRSLVGETEALLSISVLSQTACFSH